MTRITMMDLCLATRILSRNPRITIFATVTLALGIALSTTMFSIVYGGALRGLPFEEGDRIMHLGTQNVARGQLNLDVSLHDFLDWQAEQESFEQLVAFYIGTANLSGDYKPQRFNAAFVTAGTFEVLREEAFQGRTFSLEEDSPGADLVVVLGHKMWRNRFGGESAILGKTVQINGERATVVGVMGPGFEFPIKQDLWLPARLDPARVERGERRVEVFGRLRDGVSVEQANANLNTIAKRLELTYPKVNRNISVKVESFVEWFMSKNDVSLLYSMLATSFLVLLIACANVSHLLMARASSRTKEFVTRSALGASRRSLLSQLFVDSLLLSALGSVFGLLLAYLGVDLFNKHLLPGLDPPFWVRIAIDYRSYLLVAALIFVCSLISGLGPAIQASRVDLNKILKEEQATMASLRVGWFGKGIVVLELVLSCVLLTGAGLTIRSVLNLQAVELGFETESIFTTRIGLPVADYPESATRLAFYDRLLEKLRAQPDVVAAAVTSDLPTEGTRGRFFAPEGKVYPKADDYPRSWSIVVSPDFFETFGVTILQGRDFDTSDRSDTQPAVIVNQALADWIWPGEKPVGKRLRLGRGERTEALRTVVGVVPDMKVGDIHDSRVGTIYLPLAAEARRFMSVAVRGRGDPSALGPVVTRQILTGDPNLPSYQSRSMAKVVDEKIFGRKVISFLFSLFGLLALVLASVGTYGVMSFSTRQRTTEFGLRIALGARSRDILTMIVRDGAKQLSLGLLVGFPLSWFVSGLLKVWLFGVGSADPVTVMGVIMLLSLIGMGASLMAARRAAVLDPMTALRAL